MKELLSKSQLYETIKSSETVAAASLNLLVGGVALVLSRGRIGEGLFPFGVSAVAAVGMSYLPAAAIGAFIGYFIPAVSGGNFRYVAALFSVVAIRFLLMSFKKLSKTPLFLCSVTFLSLAFTAPVMAEVSSAPKLIGECFLGGALVFALFVSFRAAKERRAGFLAYELACLLISVSFLLLGLYKVSFFGINAAVCLSVLLILTSAKCGGVSAAAICGIATSFAAAISGQSGGFYALFCFAAAVCGVLSIYGKYVICLSFFATTLVALVFGGNLDGAARLSAEILVSSFVFLFLPKQFFAHIGQFFSLCPKVSVQKDVKDLLRLKLLGASEAIKDVSLTAQRVSDRLCGINSPQFAEIIKNVENATCKGCNMRLNCFETERELTVSAVKSVISTVRDDCETVLLPENFRGKCSRTESFFNNTVNFYREYSSRIAAENRLMEVRQVVTEQFSSLSLMLAGLADDIDTAEKFDKNMGMLAAAALKNIDIYPDESICKIDRFGRATLKIKAKSDKSVSYNKMQIMKAVSNALERGFDIPQIRKTDTSVFINLSESPKYKIDVGATSICASGSSMCGDCYCFFPDGQGRFIVVLSDGMGTGGAAAVSAAMCCDVLSKLIKSGFDFDCALKILNSSMLFKSTDECLSTVDIASIDLFTGDTEIYKAGAAETVVKHAGRTGIAHTASLPVGILKDVSFVRANTRLKQNDILLIMSDGATAAGTDWIRRELDNFSVGRAQDLAETLAESAKRRRTDYNDDDITVISCIINKSF